MSNYFNFFNLINHNYSKNDFISFFWKSRGHMLVTLLIADSKITNFEEINEKINYRIVSRSTIKLLLDEGVLQGYYTKLTDAKDKRKKNYKLTTDNLSKLSSISKNINNFKNT